MGIRTLFTVPEGEKVTEKHLRRVLISSVCSILLCMTCLVSATWAWFYVDIQNKGNVIQIGTPSVVVSVGGKEYDAGTALTGGTTVSITHANAPDDMNKKCPLYVTLTITKNDGGSITILTELNQENEYETAVTIANGSGTSYALTWTVSWFAPANATMLTENTVTLTEPAPTTSESTPTTSETESQEDEEKEETGSEPTSGTETGSEETKTAEEAAETTSQTTEPTSQPTEPNPTE